MVQKTVHVRKELAVPAAAVWAIARQFCEPWHPLLEWVRPERTTTGQLLRCFKGKGEENIYRECLTYHSDSERELRYTHVEGIKNVKSYAATLQVTALEQGCAVTWNATIEADGPRANEIAAGTQAIFEAGISALGEQSTYRGITISGSPPLGVTATLAKPGPLVLFLHGIGGNRRNWQRQLSSASLQYQTTAMDLRGYGNSERGEKQSTIEDYCVDILRVMAHFGKSRVVLCGMSLGSWIATSFAMRHPEKLAGLVLSGGCTGMSEAPQAEREAFLAARQKPLDAGLTPSDFAAQVVEAIAGPDASAGIREELHFSMAAISTKSYRDALTCFANPKERFDFSRITCPVLMMTGANDRLARPAEIVAVAQRIHDAARNPNVRFEVVPNAGHLCNIENPLAFNAHLEEFLRGLAT